MHPTIAPADLSMLANLLELLADPAKAKQAVKELQDANNALIAQREQGGKDLEQAKSLQTENRVIAEGLARDKINFENAQRDWTRDRDATSAQIQQIQENLRNAAIANKEQETALNRRASDMADREADLTARERMVAGYIEDYKKLNKELENRIARIREAAA